MDLSHRTQDSKKVSMQDSTQAHELTKPQMPLEVIPDHLSEYITEQDSTLYTPIDHAAWRYIMRVSKAFFATTAHPLYSEGLDATGLSTDRIPLISEMDQKLRQFGWRAVAVNGFIPPSVFMEMQSRRLLPIACDMRKLEHLGYTPSPDIVHEAAGHAPMIADPGYRKFLESYGEVARYAMIHQDDLDLYQAIYDLSEIKEDPASSPAAIDEAQKKFEQVAEKMGPPSEAALLARMAWWTTEYGLMERIQVSDSVENSADNGPLIYGAGLLSSVSESYHCLSPLVKKVSFSLRVVLDTPYDITRPQPQLFVSKTFQELTDALNQFASTMAYQRGGDYGLKAAVTSKNTTTVVLDSGVQYTGVVSDFSQAWIRMTGAKQVSFDDVCIQEISHHSLPQNMFIPLFDKSVAAASLQDIQRKLHGSGLQMLDGSRILGRMKKEVVVGGKTKVLLLEHVKVLKADGSTLYQELQKHCPIVISTSVSSVFGGAADRSEFALRNPNRTCRVKSHKTNRTAENDALNELYQQVRDFRDNKSSQYALLDEIDAALDQVATDDWLLRLELLEIYQRYQPTGLKTVQIRARLGELMNKGPEMRELIQRGLDLL